MKKIRNRIIGYKGENMFENLLIYPLIDETYIKDKKIKKAFELDKNLEKYEKNKK